MEELYNTIEKYLQGRLSKDERLEFEEKLQQDQQLKDDVEAFRLSKDIVEAGISDQLRADFAVWDKESTSTKSATIIPFRKRRKVLAIAASLVLLLSFSFLQWRSINANFNSNILAAQYHNSDLGITRSANNDNNELSAAITALQTKDYKQAIAKLQMINDTSSYYPDAQFLLADAYYLNNELQKATATLSPLLTSNNLLLKEKAEWLQLLTLLKNGQKNTAVFQQRLNQISEDANHSFQPSAADLRESLERFGVKWVN